MESYEDFIQRHYNTHDDEDDEDDPQTPVTPSSVIVFHGARVLPPLLNEQQRDDMRRLRETAVSLMKRRREEESHISFTAAERHTDQSDDITDCDITSAAPLTSTAHDGRSTNQLRASPGDDSLENTQITVLFEKHAAHRARHAPDDRSHSQATMMMSSGYVTNDNTDVTGHLATTWSGSDIISHVPVDGALLEKEGVAPCLKPAEDVVESAPCDSDEGPYRMSLQNLLKKSQEYRRRQRLLRSQARAAEEHSLSDKENQELLPKQLRMEKEAEHRIDTITNALPVSIASELPVTPRSLSASRQKRLGAVRFTNIPTPKFCLSPVRCKKRSRTPGTLRKAPGKPVGPSDRRGDVTMMSSQTEQIAQLELNLSSLKVLISDLESTLTLATDDPKPPSGVTVCHTAAAEDCGLGEEHAGSRSPGEAGSSVIGLSYDVDVPSGLWKQLTPETGGHEVTTRVKRRLLMNEDEAFGRALSSTPRVLSSAQTQEGQVTALMEDERRLQQEVLQSLAERYRFLRSVSFPCPSADSRLEDTLTSITASSVCTHAELTHTHSSSRGLSLLTAVVRGFLIRRLLRTERVSGLVRTITDSRVFLMSFQHQLTASNRHELVLQERVTQQLRAARCELHQIFFSRSCSDRMKMISCDRELRRRRTTHDITVKGSLSAATRKALERKKLMLHRKSADRKKLSPSNEEKWNLVPKICRVSKKMTALHGAR